MRVVSRRPDGTQRGWRASWLSVAMYIEAVAPDRGEKKKGGEHSRGRIWNMDFIMI